MLLTGCVRPSSLCTSIERWARWEKACVSDNSIRWRPPMPSWPSVTFSAIGIKHDRDEGIGGYAALDRVARRYSVPYSQPLQPEWTDAQADCQASIDVIRYITASSVRSTNSVATDSLRRPRVVSILSERCSKHNFMTRNLRQSGAYRTRDVVRNSTKWQSLYHFTSHLHSCLFSYCSCIHLFSTNYEGTTSNDTKMEIGLLMTHLKFNISLLSYFIISIKTVL